MVIDGRTYMYELPIQSQAFDVSKGCYKQINISMCLKMTSNIRACSSSCVTHTPRPTTPPIFLNNLSRTFDSDLVLF